METKPRDSASWVSPDSPDSPNSSDSPDSPDSPESSEASENSDVMADPCGQTRTLFQTRSVVAFADTDAAGFMHFAAYFKAMEATEHAFLRSLGLPILNREDGHQFGWPRVQAECRYAHPLRFDDAFLVLLTLREITGKTLVFDFTFILPDDDSAEDDNTGREVARGSLTTVWVKLNADGSVAALPIPEAFRIKLSGIPSS